MLSVSFPTKRGTSLLVNGGPFSEPFNAEDDEVLHLAVSRLSAHCFAGKDPKVWADQIQKGQWILANGRTATDYAQCARYEVLDKIREIGADLAECAIKPVGLDVPFWVMHLVDYLQQPEADDEEEALYEEEVVVDPDRGEFTCPTCWLKFDRADALSIAVHEDLGGIESLARMRCLDSFPPSLTRKGRPWMRWVFHDRRARPHCHRKLPLGFMGFAPSYFFNRSASECGEVLLPKRLGKAVAANSLQGIRSCLQGCRPDLQRHHQFNEEPAFCRKQFGGRDAYQDPA